MKTPVALFILRMISASSQALPAGDNLAEAAHITWPAAAGEISTSRLHTTGATTEAGEPQHSGMPPQHTVWWTFTADATGAAAVELRFFRSPLEQDTTIGFYEGSSITSLVPVPPLATGPVWVAEGKSWVFPVTAGKTYAVAASDPVASPGMVDLTLKRLDLRPYPSDNFSSAILAEPGWLLDYSRYPFGDIWYYGTLEPEEPWGGSGHPSPPETVWIDFAPLEGGWYTTYPVYSGLTVDVFSGTGLTNLQPVPLAWLQLQESTVAFFHVTLGDTFFLRPDLTGRAGAAYVTILPAEAYETFLLDAGIPSGHQSLTGNPASDGIDNLTKFTLGLDPGKNIGIDPASNHLPRLERLPDGSCEVVYTVDLRAADWLKDVYDDVFICAEFSTDLTAWQRQAVTEFDTGPEEPFVRYREIREKLPADQRCQFVRLHISGRNHRD